MLLFFVSKALHIPGLQASRQIVLRTIGAHMEPVANGEHKYLWTSASQQTGLGARIDGGGVVPL